MLALMATGLDTGQLVAYATVGNVAGGMFNYVIGSFGRLDWIEHYLHVKPEQLERAKRFMHGHGAWMCFFAFVPLLGSAITVLLGLMRANPYISVLSITLGKFIRYWLLAYGAELII